MFTRHRYLLALPLGLLLALVLLAQPVLAMSPAALKLYQTGMAALRDNQPTQALNAFESALSKTPNDAVLHQVMGETYSQLGQHQAALNHYTQVLQLHPRDTGALLSIGREWEALNEPAKALDAYATVLQRQPDYAFAHYAIAQVELKQQHWPMAISALQRFLQTYPQHLQARRQLANAYKANGQPKKAVEVYEQLSSDFPTEFTDRLPLARALNASQQHQKALQILQQDSVKTGFASPEVLNEQGYAHLALGNAGFARDAFVQAFQQSPDNPATQLGLAQAYLQTHQADSAIPLFLSYTIEHPSDLHAQQQLGQAYLQTQQLERAISTLTPLLDNPTNTNETLYWLRSNIALAHQQLDTPEQPAPQHLQQAIALYERIGEEAAQQQDWATLTNLALAYHQQGQLPQALTLYQALLNQPDTATHATLKGDAARAMVAAANTALANNDTQTAKTWLQQANTLSTHAQQPIPEISLLNASIALSDYHHTLNNDNTTNASASPVPAPLLATPSVRYHQALAANHQALVHWPNEPNLIQQRVELLLNNPSETGDPSKDTLTATQQLLRSAVDDYMLADDTDKSMLPAPLLLAKAQLAYAENSLSDATNQYQNYLNHPNINLTANEQAAHWLTLAQWYQAAKQPNNVLNATQRATELDDTNVAAWTNLATLHAQNKQWEQAKAAYQQALHAQPNAPTALYGLAVTYEQLKQPALAIPQYQAYLTSGNADYADVSKQRLTALLKTVPKTPAPIAPKQPSASVTPAANPQNTIVTEPINAAPATNVIPGQPMNFTIGGKKPINIRLNVNEIHMPAAISAPATEVTADPTPVAPMPALRYDAQPMD